MKRILLLLILLPSLAWPYTVVRKDGRSFSGDLVRETADEILIEDRRGIVVKFRTSQIDKEKTKAANADNAAKTEEKKAAQETSQAPVETKEIKREKDRSQWKGERISMDFKDIDIRDFFRFIAEISGSDMILDPSVKGTLTIKLTDVPWDQALDLVCRQHGLGYQIEGKVYNVK